MALTLEQLNAASTAQASEWLDGLYEHSPWIAQAALAHRPFRSLPHLKHAMAQIVHDAGRDAQVALIRAHPELAGKAMVSNTLTAESTNEQNKAGLTNCTPAELAHIQKLNADYGASSAFLSCWRCAAPRGTGLSKQADHRDLRAPAAQPPRLRTR